MKNTKRFIALMVVGILLVPATFASAAIVRVSWNSNSEADLDGYRVYYGTSSRIYPHVVDVGLMNSTEINGLDTGVGYYFAVTAYDTSGNESGFSAEASILIPVPEPDQDGPVQDDPEEPSPDPADDADFDGIPDGVEVSWGLDPADPRDSLADSDSDGVVNLVEYMAGTNPLDASQRPEHDDVLKDIIGEVDEIIDLTSINPDGDYLVVPLDETSPDPVENTVYAGAPGAYLYNVIGPDFELVYRLRISITAQIFAMSSFEPGIVMNLNDVLSGIAVELSPDALSREVPIGIGNTNLEAVSAIEFIGENSIEFDVIPYDLSLAVPASIIVYFDGENPGVQRYDTEEETWQNIDDVTYADGLLSFSTQELGKFRITAEDFTPIDVPEADSSSGGGCFITSARF
ncbi:MAG: fibronectin type III domain-containing protein [Desulfomonilia bacterium]